MKKSNIIALVCIIASIGAISLSFVSFAGIMLRHEVSGSNGYAVSHSSAPPYFRGVTKSNGYYNISLGFSNVTDSERLDNILINPNSPETVTDLTFYLNDTAVIAPDPACYDLKSGDSLQVDFTFPCTEFASGSTMLVCVMGNHFGWNTGVVLP